MRLSLTEHLGISPFKTELFCSFYDFAMLMESTTPLSLANLNGFAVLGVRCVGRDSNRNAKNWFIIIC